MDSKFSEVTDDTQKDFDSVLKKMNNPFTLQFLLLHNEKLKTAVKVQKVSEVYQFICKADVIVFFNEMIFAPNSGTTASSTSSLASMCTVKPWSRRTPD